MRNLEFVVADALVSADFAPEVLRDLSLPHLSVLAAHAMEDHPDSDGSRTARENAPLLTAWQQWLLRHEPQPNLAAWWACALQFAPLAPAPWVWMLEPACFQVGHDRVMLGDPRSLHLSDREAEGLADAARPVLEEAGWALTVVTSERWFVTRTEPQALYGPAMECGIGNNVALWMPYGDAATALAWRRVMNEIQMTWFVHPVNAVRETNGQNVINGIWLSGTGWPNTPRLPFAQVASSLTFLRGVLTNAHASADLETFDGLIEPAHSQDWSAWRNAVQALDLRANELLGHLRSARYDALECVFTGASHVRRWRVRRTDLWKFWRRGHAAEIFADSM